MAVVIVVVAFVLGSLTYYCANAGSGSSADESALHAAAKQRTKGRAAGSADKGSFTWTDAALTMIVVVTVILMVVIVVARVAVIVVVAAASAVAHAVIVGAVVVMVVLGGHGNHGGRDQERSEEKRFSKRAHLLLDATFCR